MTAGRNRSREMEVLIQQREAAHMRVEAVDAVALGGASGILVALVLLVAAIAAWNIGKSGMPFAPLIAGFCLLGLPAGTVLLLAQAGRDREARLRRQQAERLRQDP